MDDALAEQNEIDDESLAHLATHYRALFNIRTLASRGTYVDSVVVVADLVASGEYPFKEPYCYVISQPMPWSPHFKDGFPICLGEIWTEARGKILFGELLSHIARLLNWDEAARGGGYQGWNGEAIAYWLSELRGQPITPGLSYPVPDLRVTHDDSSAFRPRAASPGSAFIARGVR
jgi:hypothetical protein